MKRIMRGGNKIRRGFSLLLMMSMLIVLLPTATAADTVGAYGNVTVTTKNVVIRTSPAGPRTGFFAQKGTYPMIGPVIVVDGVNWYNLQTSETAGFVSGTYATASYGSAGMPSTEKTYVYLQANLLVYKGEATSTYDHTDITKQATINASSDPVIQLETGNSYTVGGVAYINLFYLNEVYHTQYTNAIANNIMSDANLNNYISEITWKASTTGLSRDDTAKGDYLTHALQAALYVLKFYDDAADGFYGTLTKQAVMDFRADNGIAPITSDVANADVFKAAFESATAMIEYIRSTPGLSGSTGGTTATTAMIKTTIKNVRLRKSYTTSSAYVGIVTDAGTILTYTRTHVSGTTTWYYVQYNGTYGWVMGTYTEPYTTTPGGTTPTPVITNYGTVTITKKLVAIRVTANGKRTGYHVNTGDVCTLIGPVVTAGGYSWYNIRTENGRTGYVRGDCATAQFGSAGMPDTTKKYVQFLYDGMQIRKGADPATATDPWVTLTKSAVLQLATGSNYTSGGVDYINVYFGNVIYHAKYTNALVDGLMSQDNVNNYISGTVWAQAFGAGDIAGLEATATVNIFAGDVRVHAIQAALYQLGLYDDKMDGMFGTKTATGIIKFKQKNGIMPENDIVNTAVSTTLFSQAKAALQAKLSAGGGTDTGDGTVPAAGNFGTVNTVKKGSWSEIDGGAKSLFPKGTVATVMSVETKQVFRLYRWSGANHADCVPYDTSDTATLCSILGFTYNASHPNSTDLGKIKTAGTDDYPLYTWPDFRGGLGATAITGSKEKIPVWVNLNGTVYCASIYTIPHGFDGTSGFSKSKLNGQLYYERNNMYGMLCVHFYGSTTHASGIVNSTHMNNVNYAYNKAAAYFGASKVK
jgi:peptidoglycan hydrolase-like protein with peptidoglycan-binding domain